jgi:hypothetical protein
MVDRETKEAIKSTVEKADRSDLSRSLGGSAVGAEMRYLIEMAQQLTLDTGVPHGVKTDIHGQRTVVRYGRNRKI